ncbi:hypothetical protein [Oceanospirillum sanctuarii]|uniref:hypothetical protein n=1 Tax=Oceanospirillum sanctuarii TaxID=1434821 RepID=UPI001C3CF653|nr:hypothetical protein [Oceanospirillum sanctuarii]
MLVVDYTLRENGDELVNKHRELKSFRDACEVIDQYPWIAEIEKTEELGEGGGFYFFRDEGDKHASFQLTPIETDRAFLDMEVVQKSGFLGLFGRKSLHKDFETVTIPEAKALIKDLFDHTVDSLYGKYSKKGKSR